MSRGNFRTCIALAAALTAIAFAFDVRNRRARPDVEASTGAGYRRAESEMLAIRIQDAAQAAELARWDELNRDVVAYAAEMAAIRAETDKAVAAHVAELEASMQAIEPRR